MLGLDIYSGEIKTTQKDNIDISEDTFILRYNEKIGSFNDFSYQLGVLMESLLSQNQDPEKILNLNTKRKIPDLSEIIRNGFEYIIEEKEKNQIFFYFETLDRSGLLVSFAKFFYKNSINIIEAKIQTEYDNIAKDSFILEYDHQDSIKNLKKELEKYIENSQI
ncbi:MAG: hypothetical protein KatS3mg129_3191 [Leptospiraceae bacterium]|nr:MAG: hypothetical protein KatS3mg129_3191 [Leptospiraceae bacterium]